MSKIEYNKILIQPGAGKTTCQVFVFDLLSEAGEIDETKPAEPAQNKKIFLLIEIESPPSRKITSFINSLSQEIRNFRPGDPDKAAEYIFEKLVQKVNYRYLDLIGNKSSFGDGETPVPKINALLALEEEKNIYLAQRGNVFPFLIYQVKPQNYKIINIAESASGKEGRGNINLFTNIISGKMNPEDYLAFSTESMLDYFSLEKICKTISGSSPEEAANSFETLLSESANPKTAFAALILKLKPDQQTAAIPAVSDEQKKIYTPQGSMETLLKTAHNTEKMLTPSLRLNIGSGISSFFQKIKASREEKKQIKTRAKLEYYSSQFTPPSRVNKILKPFSWLLLAVFRTIYLIFRTIVLSFFKFLKAFFRLITGKRKTDQEATGNIVKTPEKNIVVPAEEKKPPPRRSRVLLVSAIVIVCLFIAGTFYLYFKYEKEAVAESLKQKTEDIQNKKNAAEASLIYNDEAGAAEILAEADSLLAAFPQTTNDEKTAFENIEKGLETLREKIRHAVNIDNPISVVNFSDHNPSAAVNEFIIYKNNLYAFDSLASAVYKINLETKEIVNKNAPGLSLRFGFMENEDSALFYQPEKKFFSFDLKEDILKQQEVVLNENETRIDGLALYNQKLYILDTDNNQIFKHLPAESGYSRGTPWIKDGTGVKNAVSFAIDGSIYLAFKNGEIAKLDNGKKTGFSYSVDPALASPTKIWTSPESSYIYILEQAGKRLVVLDKEGKLKVQYVSEQFNDLKDFVVLEKEKEIYLLSANQIFGIIATHLE